MNIIMDRARGQVREDHLNLFISKNIFVKQMQFKESFSINRVLGSLSRKVSCMY